MLTVKPCRELATILSHFAINGNQLTAGLDNQIELQKFLLLVQN